MQGDQKDSLNPVAAYRERFKRAPLGRWQSFVDFGPFAVDVWEFYGDGTGKILHYAGSGDYVTLFAWQAEAERTIKLRETQQIGLDQAGEEPGSDDQDISQDWSRIVYDFKLIQHRAPVVMFQVPERDAFKFWWTTDYLRFTGDIAV